MQDVVGSGAMGDRMKQMKCRREVGLRRLIYHDAFSADSADFAAVDLLRLDAFDIIRDVLDP